MPPPVNPQQYISLAATEFKNDAFLAVPKWLQKKIAKSHEFIALVAAGMAKMPDDAPAGAPAGTTSAAVGGFDDPDIPF